MADFSFLTLADIWLVLGTLAGYQLYLQRNMKSRQRYPEGFVLTLQYLSGIPALGSLILFLVDPDEVSFVFITLPLVVNAIGLVLFNGAALVILWSHIELGRFWSDQLETLPQHRVIQSGPYAYVRHPLYSSYLVLTIGFFLATANWLVGALMLIYFLTVAARAWKEEAMLITRLGPAYQAYREKTRRFFPFPRRH